MGRQAGLIPVKVAATATPVIFTRAISIRAGAKALPVRGLTSEALGLNVASSRGGRGLMPIALVALSSEILQEGLEDGRGSKDGLIRRTLLKTATGPVVRDRPSGFSASRARQTRPSIVI